MILERLVQTANWFAGLEVALTLPPGVPERRDDEDHWNPETVERPRRIADDLAWFRAVMDHPAEAGLRPLDEALPSTWDVGGDPEAGERLLRLEARGVLAATGFALHQPDLTLEEPAG